MGRFRDRNAKMFLVNSARMFPDSSVKMFQDSNVRMFPVKYVTLFQDSSVGTFPPRSAAVFPDRSVRMFHDSSANKCRSRFATLPSLLMEGSKKMKVRKDNILLHSITQIIAETKKEALNYNLILWKKPENLNVILMYLFKTSFIYFMKFHSSQPLV